MPCITLTLYKYFYSLPNHILIKNIIFSEQILTQISNLEFLTILPNFLQRCLGTTTSPTHFFSRLHLEASSSPPTSAPEPVSLKAAPKTVSVGSNFSHQKLYDARMTLLKGVKRFLCATTSLSHTHSFSRRPTSAAREAVAAAIWSAKTHFRTAPAPVVDVTSVWYRSMIVSVETSFFLRSFFRFSTAPRALSFVHAG